MRQRQQLIDDMDKKEVQDFDAEFESMLRESNTQAKKGIEHMPQQRREIIIPVSQIKRKMPEIGQIHIHKEATDEVASNSKMAVPSGGIKIAGSKMAFALITKSNQGKKIKVQKIAIDSESQLVKRTQMRMAEDEREKQEEKRKLKDIQAKIIAAQQLENSDEDDEENEDEMGSDQEAGKEVNSR